uniref:hypothetical protein n=1 Tax=Paraglaciecola sp. TaxID=1920173 RepID=UPI0030F47BB0
SLNIEISARLFQRKSGILVALQEILSKLSVFSSLICVACVFNALSRSNLYRLCLAKIDLAILSQQYPILLISKTYYWA